MSLGPEVTPGELHALLRDALGISDVANIRGMVALAVTEKTDEDGQHYVAWHMITDLADNKPAVGHMLLHAMTMLVNPDVEYYVGQESNGPSPFS
jgi:hypothetical protein